MCDTISGVLRANNFEQRHFNGINRKERTMNAALGPLEAQALAYAQSRHEKRLETGTLLKALGWSGERERKVLSRLARKGLIVRVRRGLYLVPAHLLSGGRWSPGEFLALDALIRDRDGRYQISGPSTFHRYGWTEQVPNRLYAYNNRISGDREMGAAALSLIKVADDRLGGAEVVRTPDGVDVVYATKARSLVDAVRDYSRFDSLPRAFDWIREEVRKDEGFAAELVQAALEFGNQATLRRIGGALERCSVPQRLLQKIERALHVSLARIPWIPGRPKRGTASRRWGIVFNDE